MDSLATAAIISEDPHAVLVEFSSVVADTQEYIIKVIRKEAGLRESVVSPLHHNFKVHLRVKVEIFGVDLCPNQRCHGRMCAVTSLIEV